MAKNGELFYGEFGFTKPPLSPFFAIILFHHEGQWNG